MTKFLLELVIKKSIDIYFIYWFRTVNMSRPKGVQKSLNL